MAIFKCKMCSGVLNVQEGQSVIECDYCSTSQTLPRLNTERRSQLYDRANHHWRNNEYDKAMGMYEMILNEDGTDAEAYWSIVLCRFGVSYVKDPHSGRYFLTVNRMMKTSIKTDADFKAAYQHANDEQRVIYLEEAKKILAIQQKYDAIYKEEEPFDIFISYKETDANGKRTHDSVLAYDLYHQLTQEGFKVFFSRVTLENILGTEYEPYIFAALNSSKVMIVLGTKPEHFNAVWVKNEWSRYLALIRNGEQKVLIPAYKDMDAYDMPDEFQHLQAQDMSKLGFMQDLIRGINKILSKEDKQSQSSVNLPSASTGGAAGQLLKRATLFLEDGDWVKADEYCEKVLDLDPENAKAYLVKLCCELSLKNVDSLSDHFETLEKYTNYRNALKFAQGDYKEVVEGYNSAIINRIKERIDTCNQKAEECLNKGDKIKAAICYHRGGNIEGLYSTFDFSKMLVSYDDRFLTIGVDSTACNQTDGKIKRNIKMVSRSESHELWLKNDGTVDSDYSSEYGYNSYTEEVKEWTDIVTVVAGKKISYGLKKDGKIISTMSKLNKVFVLPEWSDIVNIYPYGDSDFVALKKDGTVLSTSDICARETATWKNIVFISTFKRKVAGIKQDGSVVNNFSLNTSSLKNIVNLSIKTDKYLDEIYAVDYNGDVFYVNSSFTEQKGNAGTSIYKHTCKACGFIFEGSDICPMCQNKIEINSMYDRASLAGIQQLNNILAVSCLTGYSNANVALLKSDGTVVFTGNKYGKDSRERNISDYRQPVRNNLFKPVGEVSDDMYISFKKPKLKPLSDKAAKFCMEILRDLKEDVVKYHFEKYDDSKNYYKPKDYTSREDELAYYVAKHTMEYVDECRSYIYSELRRVGFDDIDIEFSLKLDSSSDIRKDIKIMFARRSGISYDNLVFNYPTIEKNVKSSIGNSQKDSKPVITNSAKRNFKKATVITTVIAIVLALGIFLFSTGNYPGGDGLVGDIFRTLSNNIEDIKDTFGIDIGDEEKTTAAAHDYYIKSNDYDSINIRTKSNSDSAVLTTVSSRSVKLYPTGEKSGKWIQIRIDGEIGWVHNSVVEYVD